MSILATKINHLGDMVSFLPTLDGILRNADGRRVVLLCTPLGREVASAALPGLTYITVDYARARHLRSTVSVLPRIAREISSHGCSISLHSYDEPSIAYLSAAAARVPLRIGFASGIARLQNWLNEQLPFSTQRNVVDLNYDLVRRMAGCSELSPARVPLRPDPATREAALRSLDAAGVEPGQPFVALHGGAKASYREWGVERFLTLARSIEERMKLPAVMLDDRTSRFASARRLVATPTISELAVVLEHARVFVGNNSGPMHIAACMGTQCVVIQGPTPPCWELDWPDVPVQTLRSCLTCVPCERLGHVPGHCTNREDPLGCMKAISVADVRRAVEKALSSEPSSHCSDPSPCWC